MTQLFLDLDGVFADFDTAYFNLFGAYPDKEVDEPKDMWDKIKAHGNFFRELPQLPDAQVFWEYAKKFDPIILTGAPHNIPDVAEQKVDWVRANLCESVPVIVCRSKEKSKNCMQGDILVDDWEKYMHLWKDAGGTWVTHHSAISSIYQLEKIYGT